MTRHAAYFIVTHELLAALLALPADARITEIAQDGMERRAGVFSVYVEHPDLPEVPEGALPPPVQPIIEDGEPVTRSAPRFAGWGRA